MACVQFLDFVNGIAMMIPMCLFLDMSAYFPGVYAPSGLAGGMADVCLKGRLRLL